METEDLLPPFGSLVYDVGANIGKKTKTYLRRDCRVIAVEPQPKCIQRMSKRFHKKIKAGTLVLIPSALGGKEGTQKMFLCDKASTLASMDEAFLKAVQKTRRFKKHTWSSQIEVPVTTLEALFTKYGIPNYIKIDTEGYERVVLSGLETPIQHVSIEFTPEIRSHTFESIDLLLELSQQYRFNITLAETGDPFFKEWVPASIVKNQLSQFNYPTWGDVHATLAS